MKMNASSSVKTPAPTKGFPEWTQSTLPVQNQPWLKILLWTCYSIIFLLGVGGNSAVCFILNRRKSLRTVTNLFILNLAISDLIFSCSIPLEFPIILSDYKWPYASFFCKIYGPVQTIALSVSIFTLAAVSLVRYRAINHPLKRQVSSCNARYILCAIWIVSTILLVPHSITLQSDGTQCNEVWPSLKYKKMYTTFLFIVFYVIPLSIITFAYIKIIKELLKKGNCENSALSEAWNKETTKVIQMFFKVTIVFAVCNLPSQLMWLWLDYGQADQTFDHFSDLLAALNILIFANSAANPFIYYRCHDRFRSEAITYLSEYQWFLHLRRSCPNVCRNSLQHSLELEKEIVDKGTRTLGENSTKERSFGAASNLLEKTQETYV